MREPRQNCSTQRAIAIWNELGWGRQPSSINEFKRHSDLFLEKERDWEYDEEKQGGGFSRHLKREGMLEGRTFTERELRGCFSWEFSFLLMFDTQENHAPCCTEGERGSIFSWRKGFIPGKIQPKKRVLHLRHCFCHAPLTLHTCFAGGMHLNPCNVKLNTRTVHWAFTLEEHDTSGHSWWSEESVW